MSEYHQRIPCNGSMETDRDLENEQEIKRRFEENYNCTLTKQNKYDPMDFIASQHDKAVCWVEMRRRNIKTTTYRELYFGLNKFNQLSCACLCLGIPCILIVTMNDGVRWIDLTQIEDPEITEASRGDVAVTRSTDNEPCILIPISDMKVFR